MRRSLAHLLAQIVFCDFAHSPTRRPVAAAVASGDEWLASGQPWDAYRHAWMAREGMHTGLEILAELDKRFQCDLSMFGPYFFVDPPDTTEFDELAAIRAGDPSVRNPVHRQTPSTTPPGIRRPLRRPW
jgi:hypothetical protein